MQRIPIQVLHIAVVNKDDVSTFVVCSRPSCQAHGPCSQAGCECVAVCIFLYRKASRSIAGAAVFVEVHAVVPDPENAWWTVARGVALEREELVTREMVMCYGGVFLLRPAVEAKLRTSSVVPGGLLATHFPEFEAKRFRCFAIDDQEIALILRDPGKAVIVRTPATYVGCAGVVPIRVQDVPIKPEDDILLDEGEEDAPVEEAAPPAVAAREPFTVAQVEHRLERMATATGGGQ